MLNPLGDVTSGDAMSLHHLQRFYSDIIYFLNFKIYLLVEHVELSFGKLIVFPIKLIGGEVDFMLYYLELNYKIS